MTAKLFAMKESLWSTLYKPLSESFTKTATLYATLVRPKSRGHIRLRSMNAQDPPIIDPRYYSHPDDIQVMIEGKSDRFI